MNFSALLNRMNFALALATGKLRATSVTPQQLLGSTDVPSDSEQILVRLESEVLGGDVSAQTHSTVSRQLTDPKIAERRLDDPARLPNIGIIAGLLLGSPEFQRR